MDLSYQEAYIMPEKRQGEGWWKVTSLPEAYLRPLACGASYNHFWCMGSLKKVAHPAEVRSAKTILSKGGHAT